MKSEKKLYEKLNDFLSSKRGKTIVNYCYSLGAAVVILGAMFKILHLRGGSQMLAVGMITEVFVFIIFAFEKQSEELHWESVFPALRTQKEEDNYLKIMAEKGIQNSGGGALPEVSAESAKKLAESINKLDQAATQLFKMAEMTEVTQSYVTKMASVSTNFEKFGKSTAQLAEISDSMAGAYGNMKENSELVKNNYSRYSDQMLSLTDNISGLSKIYHEQMTAITLQIESITQLHNELTLMASLYEGSSTNASKFKTETEKMAEQLVSLNSIYDRMIKAMTANYAAKG
jgi:gliding motility-associated protein GldL